MVGFNVTMVGHGNVLYTKADAVQECGSKQQFPDEEFFVSMQVLSHLRTYTMAFKTNVNVWTSECTGNTCTVVTISQDATLPPKSSSGVRTTGKHGVNFVVCLDGKRGPRK